MTILAYIIYALICIGVFVYFQLDRPTGTINLTQTEYVILTLLLSLVSPAALVILAIGYPFYLLHRFIHRNDVQPEPADDDDDEPQGFDYHEHEDWTDGTVEYEDD